MPRRQIIFKNYSNNIFTDIKFVRLMWSEPELVLTFARYLIDGWTSTVGVA